MAKKRRRHRVIFIDGDSGREIPPEIIGEPIEASAYTPKQAFAAALKKKNILYARRHFGDIDIEIRVQVKYRKRWRPVPELGPKDYMELYEPDEYQEKYGRELKVRQLPLF